ncbi:MAG: acyltransferase family protein [Agriterribacter sp.]
MIKGSTHNEFSQPRITQLDGLRGVALLLVLGFHFINNQYMAMDANSLQPLQAFLMKATYFGWCGVDLFFVLSGFLIGSILLKNKGSANFFKVFYIRRFIRIIPAYYLLLLLFLLCKNLKWFTPEAAMFEKEIPIGYYFLFLQNFYMSFNGHFGPEALTPTWSLAVEEQFYIIIPFAVHFLSRKQLILFLCICLIVAPVSRHLSPNWYQEYTLLSSRIDSPAIGVLLACINYQARFKNFIQQNLTAIKFGTFALFSMAAILYIFADPGMFNHTIIAICFGCTLLIVLYSNSGVIYKILTTKVLLEVGKLSYFIYLFHQLINGIFHLVFLSHNKPVLDDSWAVAVSCLALFVTYILAKCSFRFFEGPLIKLGHAFKY